MAKVKFRTLYSSIDEDKKGILFESDSLCQQHFRDECDVNKIVERYVKTGVLEHTSDFVPHFADVSDVPSDLMAAYAAVGAAEAAFMELPSDLRKELDNDPSKLGNWLLNKDNRDAAVKYGLLNPLPVDQNPQVVPGEKQSEVNGDNAS